MVKYYDWKWDLSDIKGKIDRGELKPDPDWQRGYIWKPNDEQLLIDSILRGIPIPQIYLTVEYDRSKQANVYYAVDGQQRLTAVHKFLSNKFPIQIQGKQLLFKELGQKLQQSITTYKFAGHYMEEFNQADITFLFQRLNRTGIKLTNMEEWHSKFSGSNILKMLSEIHVEHKGYYIDTIYTEENILRMLSLDDILDLCNCLDSAQVQSGSRKDLPSFLERRKNISSTDSASLKSKFRKVINNLSEILPKQDLETSAYGKRTHFISLFLAVGLFIPKYYILSNVTQLKNDLIDFIQNQPDEYRESVLGAIRQKAKREKRVKLVQAVILKHALQLDGKRLFDEALKQKFWHKGNRACGICNKPIHTYAEATLDHITPWAKGGRTTEANAQLAHSKCNSKRRDSSERFIIL
jgi:5-methylcytosine-specific restriction endonuclease McrA